MATKIKTKPWDSVEYLKTDADFAGYLDACLEIGDPALVAKALGIIARARGMTKVAKDTDLGRESLYRALSADGNPSLATVMKVAKALGLRLSAHAG